MTDDMNEMFDKNHSLLITNVVVEGRNVDIAIDETGLITGIGENGRKQWKVEADYLIDGNGSLALPGLVNTHTHAAMSLLRGYADDMILQDWLSQKIWPLEAHLTPEDVYWGTRLACLEMIRSGTTAFNDMYFMMDQAAKAVDEAGIRAVLSYGFIDLFSAEKREAECKATGNLVSHGEGDEQPADQGLRRTPRDLHGLSRRAEVVRGICKGTGDRDPHPPLRDREGGDRLRGSAREAAGRPPR